ncbi:MAG: DUF1292 domain-containing protein [Candidatus Cloacimonetes bacterium]|jgi:hypothetical protein|nr:DUF1292 domain-containing protein [Candidatus Cloacimonadota bacterium]MDD2423817.1 DUF1292 domain-containing protein [Candidatus Cloacimonadota bacterium]MDD4277095.1 DUF1292 domain-containing protein [Candidatus Cloacimonadota bacterium]MDY0325943.1 DUF1292 domain-containing protein [Candidatus Cloacimonadaceae bacterium]
MTHKHIDPNLKNEDHEDMEDELSRVITLEMEDGTEKDFVALDMLEHEGINYIALSEVDSMEYDVLRFVEVDDALELSIIEDDAEYDKVTDLFKEKFEEMFYDDDDYDDADDEDDEDEDEEDDKDDEVDEVEKELTS